MQLPREDRLRWLLRHAALLLEGGAEPVRGLVLPTVEFFPDHFDGSPRAVERLLGRVVGHAGLGDLGIRLGPSEPDPQGEHGGQCCGGSCAGGGSAPAPVRRVTERDGGFLVNVGAHEVGQPAVLTTALVRGVSHAFLREADLYRDVDPRQAEAVVDVAGVLLGFGVLLANGAYIYAKGCGGVRVASATALPVEEVTTALALFCQLHDLRPRNVRGHLGTTARALFDEASDWAAANSRVVRLLRADRAVIEADGYSLNEARGWLSRLVGLGRRRGPTVPDEAELERMATEAARNAEPGDPDKARRLAALRELVDESFER